MDTDPDTARSASRRPGDEEGAPSPTLAPVEHAAGNGTRRRDAWVPSLRVTAALAAAMLAIGVGVGAAIGPAPEATFAGAARLPLLLRSLLGSQAGSSAPSAASAQTAAGSQSQPTLTRRRRRAASTAAAGEAASAPTSEEGSPTAAAKGPGAAAKTKPLPPVTKVWLIALAGSSFSEALAAPAAAPYIDTQAIPAGSLLTAFSSLQASAFADDAALISTTEPQLVDSIIQPPCPEGAAAAQCAPGTAAGLTAADTFLAATIPTITSTAAYRTNGLIVVTFGAIADGASSGLASGSTTASLSSRPPAGALLISPFVSAGKRPSTTFNAASPRQSLEALLHR